LKQSKRDDAFRFVDYHTIIFYTDNVIHVKFSSDLSMYGDITPELERCKDTIMVTLVIGAIMGGVGRSRVAYMNFFRSNQHTAFETPMKAKSKLQETLLMGFGSGAYRIGWRVGVFSAIYS